MKPLVSIVNVTWNGRHLLEKHLPSLEAIEYSNIEVIIVDNGSVDDSVNFLKLNYPKFKLICNKENLGTALGSNVALPLCAGKYIFFVSNDMEFDKSIVKHLVEICEEDSSIGICTVKMKRLTDEKFTNIIDSVGANIDFLGFPRTIGINENDLGQHDNKSEVFFSFGGALFIKRELFEIVGGYDSEFLTLADDIDLSWRVRLLGYKVMVNPKAFLYHRVSATLSKSHNRAEKRYISERNTLRTLLKNYKLINLAWVLPFWIIVQIFESLFFLIVLRPKIAIAGFRAVKWNLEKYQLTLCERKKVQRYRIISDLEIIRSMHLVPEKIKLFIDLIRNPNALYWKSYFNKS